VCLCVVVCGVQAGNVLEAAHVEQPPPCPALAAVPSPSHEDAPAPPMNVDAPQPPAPPQLSVPDEASAPTGATEGEAITSTTVPPTPTVSRWGT
jgi:hypothetical protein